MSCTLINHARGYHLSCAEAFLAIGTLSGMPYSLRHWELSEHCLGHRVIAFIEALPVIGILALLIERIVFYLFFKTETKPPSAYEHFKEAFSNIHAVDLTPSLRSAGASWTPRSFSIQKCMQKMLRNLVKALAEHKKTAPEPSPGLSKAYPGKIPPIITPQPVTLSCSEYEAQGRRAFMEDAHIYLEEEEGYLAGVFDGHGGANVSKAIKEHLEKEFFTLLKKMQGNVYCVFETFIYQLHQKIIEMGSQPGMSFLKRQGSTLVICFIEKKTGLIYIATSGDSEAFLFRTLDNGADKKKFKYIPLT